LSIKSDSAESSPAAAEIDFGEIVIVIPVEATAPRNADEFERLRSGDQVECAASCIDLIVVFLFALVRTELLAFIKKLTFHEPRSSLTWPPAAAAARRGCDRSNLLPQTRSAWTGYPSAIHRAA
jgi:hypothetical protein